MNKFQPETYDLNEADNLFYQRNYGKGAKRTLAAIAVKAQTLMRPDRKTTRNNKTNKNSEIKQEENMEKKSSKQKNSKKADKKVIKKEVKAQLKKTDPKPREAILPVAYSAGAMHMASPILKEEPLTGFFVLGDIKTSSANLTDKAGTILIKRQIDASLFVNSRIRRLFNLYERWSGSVTFSYRPSTSFTSAGLIVHGVDLDPDDGVLKEPANRTLAQYKINKVFDVKNGKNSIIKVGSQKRLFTNVATTNGFANDVQLRWNSMGVYFLVVESDVTPDVTLGSIIVHYNLRFWDITDEDGDGDPYFINKPVVVGPSDKWLSIWSQEINPPFYYGTTDFWRIADDETTGPVLRFHINSPGKYVAAMQITNNTSGSTAYNSTCTATPAADASISADYSANNTNISRTQCRFLITTFKPNVKIELNVLTGLVTATSSAINGFTLVHVGEAPSPSLLIKEELDDLAKTTSNMKEILIDLLKTDEDNGKDEVKDHPLTVLKSVERRKSELLNRLTDK